MVETTSVACSELLRRATGAGLAPGFVGLAVGPEGDGRCWCAGRVSLAGPATEPATWYDLASLTKPLASTTLTLLARRDGLDLQAPLEVLLEELAGGPWADVTVTQVLAHTAGFPAWAPLYAGGTSPERYLDALNAVRPLGRPGEHVVYSCLGFVALGIALERAAGADLATLFAELVAEPLGLSGELRYVPDEGTPVAAGELEPFVERAALRELGLSGAPPDRLRGVVSCNDGNARGLGGMAGNAGLFGTAAAVAALAAEYLPGGGELLSGEEADLATRCRTEGLEQARGLGWQLAASPGCSAGPSLSAQAFGHTGFTGTSVWLEPRERTVSVLLGNRLHPGGRTPDLGPLRRRFNTLARLVLSPTGDAA